MIKLQLEIQMNKAKLVSKSSKNSMISLFQNKLTFLPLI